MEATIHYLDWAHEAADETARTLFHNLHGSSPDAVPKDYYRRVGVTQITDDIEDDMAALNYIYSRWNATDETRPDAHDAVYESTLMCERCGAVFGETAETLQPEPAIRHAEDEHGYRTPPARSETLPDYIHGIRSMSVGDVIDLNGTLYLVASFGFNEVEWSETIPSELEGYPDTSPGSTDTSTETVGDDRT